MDAFLALTTSNCIKSHLGHVFCESFVSNSNHGVLGSVKVLDPEKDEEDSAVVVTDDNKTQKKPDEEDDEDDEEMEVSSCFTYLLCHLNNNIVLYIV